MRLEECQADSFETAAGTEDSIFYEGQEEEGDDEGDEND